MGRPARKAQFLEERRYLAALIDAALKTGQRGDGTSKKHWQPWTETAFAARAGTGASSVSDWRDPGNPTRPTNIVPLLKTFYGDIPIYKAHKEKMRRAWQLAGGIDADEPPDPRHIATHSFTDDVAEIATLLVNQPTPDNQGNLRVPYTLRMRCDEGLTFDVKVDGEQTSVVMDIGLTKPLFSVESSHWQPMQDTIFRKRKHRHTAPGPGGDCVMLTGETDKHGRIVGEPLEDEAHIVMEPKGVSGDGPITLAVKTPRDGLHVTLADGGAISPEQKDVIDAIFALGIPRDNRNRLEITSAVIVPKAAKPPE
jgi:hypothetical protein